MGRQPLPLGSWGRVWSSAVGSNGKGPRTFRARASFRDFDGVTREVVARGKTKTTAEAHLLVKLRERAAAQHGASLKSSDRFSVAASLWLEQLDEKVVDGTRAPSTVETYRRKLRLHVLPALGEVRLGEVTTPLVDKVIQSIKRGAGAPTARSSRSVISGVLGLAARHGAIATNPVRDADPVPSTPNRRPRALTDTERREWFALLARNPAAAAADLPDLCLFLLATGARIGEALGLLWADVDLEHGLVAITGQVTRVTGQGLVRGPTKSSAGRRVLVLPVWGREMMAERSRKGVSPDQPVFSDALGGYRDPNNVRRDLRRARAPRGSEARQQLGAALAAARRSAGESRADVARSQDWPRTRLELLESGRVRAELDIVTTLLDHYCFVGEERSRLLEMAVEASRPSDDDALTWITSHSFRKTNATILDDAGLSARQIADQLGHARPSLTMDVYMGRGTSNRAAAAALEHAIAEADEEGKDGPLPGHE